MSESLPLPAAVVVASNRAAAGVYADETGPLIVDALRGWGFEVDAPAVVPDGDPVRAGVVGLVLVVLVPVGWERVRPVGPRRATGSSAEPARAGRTAARRAAEKRSAEKRPGSHAR